MSARTILAFACSLWFCFSTFAEPLNIMVGEWTFTRPEKWQWDATSKNKMALARMVVPNGSGGHLSADIRFFLSDKDADALVKLWTDSFPDANGSARTETKKNGKIDLTYLSIHGTYNYLNTKPRPGYMLVGAVIPSGKQFVNVRLLGLRQDVEKIIPDFKKLIEGAVREKEAE